MDTRYSDKANDLARKKDQLAVAVAAEAYRDDFTLDPLVIGFNLAMTTVRMGALTKYLGADLKVWAVVAEGPNAMAYFVASGEEELLARLAALPNA